MKDLIYIFTFILSLFGMGISNGIILANYNNMSDGSKYLCGGALLLSLALFALSMYKMYKN